VQLEFGGASSDVREWGGRWFGGMSPISHRGGGGGGGVLKFLRGRNGETRINASTDFRLSSKEEVVRGERLKKKKGGPWGGGKEKGLSIYGNPVRKSGGMTRKASYRCGRAHQDVCGGKRGARCEWGGGSAGNGGGGVAAVRGMGERGESRGNCSALGRIVSLNPVC